MSQYLSTRDLQRQIRFSQESFGKGKTAISNERKLELIAWNDVRHAFVVQATDAPTTPYAPTVVFQLFLEQPYGEWLVDQFVWAATMDGGESIIVGTHDASVALAAKSCLLAKPIKD